MGRALEPLTEELLRDAVSSDFLVSQEENRYLEEVASLGFGVARDVALHHPNTKRRRHGVYDPSHLAAEAAVRLAEKRQNCRQRLPCRASAG